MKIGLFLASFHLNMFLVVRIDEKPEPMMAKFNDAYASFSYNEWTPERFGCDGKNVIFYIVLLTGIIRSFAA